MSARPRNFRRRTDNNSDDPETPSTTTPSSTTTTVSAKSKKPISKVPKLLSFADDEETESTTPLSRQQHKKTPASSSSSRLGKPSSSHKLSSSKDRNVPHSSSVLPSNVQPQAGTYTKEALLELQKNTKTLASSKTPSSASSEPVIVLKGLLKPIGINGNKSHDNNKEIVEEGDEKEEDNVGLIKKVEKEAPIPDQETINAIRAKRERLRQSRAAAHDYISLDGGINHGENNEGMSDEEPEFRGRITMLGEKVERRGVFEEVEEIGIRGKDEGGEDDYDEEDKIWEEEQLRKVVGKRIDDSASSSAASVAAVHSVAQPVYANPVVAPPNIGGAVGMAQGLEVISIAQQADIARRALQDNMRRLKESHGKTMMTLSKNDENLSASLLNISSLENSLSAVGEKFIFMQKLRDFISGICELLQDKAPFIEELEEKIQKLHEDRASTVLERRSDDNDEMIEMEAAVNAAMTVFNNGGQGSATIAAATAAAQKVVDSLRIVNLPVNLDEFGRDMNNQKRLDMTKKAAARKRRRALADAKRSSSMEIDGFQHRVEGESSTDESDNENAVYQSHCDEYIKVAGQIFGDVAEEYSQLSAVKEMFERWKKEYSASYRDAYMSISIAAIFSPYVRLELLKWDPLRVAIDFDKMEWYSLLNEFSPDNADPDTNLIPELVEKVALPILHHEITHCWDTLSTNETRKAVWATNLIATYIPAESEAFGELLVTVCNHLSKAVASIMVPTWSPLVMTCVPNSARVAAYGFGTSIRLMSNIFLWREILSISALEKLAIDELLVRKILPHLRAITSNAHDAITRTERIIASLSGYRKDPSRAAASSKKLQPLVDYVVSLGRILEKKHAVGVSETETGGLARRLKKILVDLDEYDEARAISRAFHIKEAL